MTNAIWANDGIMMFIYSNLKVVLDSSEIVFIFIFHHWQVARTRIHMMLVDA